MNRLFRPALLAAALACPTIAWGADAQQVAVERFVRMVKSGEDVKNSEFGEAVSAGDAAKLQALAKCEPAAPRTSDSGTSALIMWTCDGQAANGEVGTMLSFEDGKVASIFVMGAVIVPVRSQ